MKSWPKNIARFELSSERGWATNIQVPALVRREAYDRYAELFRKEKARSMRSYRAGLKGGKELEPLARGPLINQVLLHPRDSIQCTDQYPDAFDVLMWGGPLGTNPMPLEPNIRKTLEECTDEDLEIITAQILTGALIDELIDLRNMERALAAQNQDYRKIVS